MVTPPVSQPLTGSLHAGVELPEELGVNRRAGGDVGCGTVSFPDGSGVEFHILTCSTCNYTQYL